MSAIVAGLVALALLLPAAAKPPGPDVEMFTREGCSFCAAAHPFLEELRRERPALRIQVRDVEKDPRALDRLIALARQHGVEHPGVGPAVPRAVRAGGLPPGVRDRPRHRRGGA